MPREATTIVKQAILGTDVSNCHTVRMLRHPETIHTDWNRTAKLITTNAYSQRKKEKSQLSELLHKKREHHRTNYDRIL
jgi:hypothetical protein